MDEEMQYVQLERVVQLVEWNRLEDAITEAENYIQQYPEDAGGYALLSKIYLMQEDFEKAWYWSQEALKQDPEHEVAWEARVGTLYTEGIYVEAMTELKMS